MWDPSGVVELLIDAGIFLRDGNILKNIIDINFIHLTTVNNLIENVVWKELCANQKYATIILQISRRVCRNPLLSNRNCSLHHQQPSFSSAQPVYY
jgi:hypothetical protein